ncbi:MAG TPA: amino acid permease [Steroidobacteraceae bacterium]|nr:amino acid permease [Steroidobacteraceae bacterium]
MPESRPLATPDCDEWGERMPRTVGLLDAMAVLVGVTIGSGIFRAPATVAGQLQAPGPVLLCWVLGGVIALCGALTIAELAGALPRSGGVFAWLLESFGPLPAFLFGWTELAVIRAASLGATATIFAEYLGYFTPLTQMQVRYVAAVLIVVIGAMNYFGVRRAAVVMSTATVAKYLALLGLGILAFTAPTGGVAHFDGAWDGGVHVSLLATALIPIMWTYDGWADLSFMAGEVKDPQRTLPLALILGTAAVMLVYLLLNVGFIYVMRLSDMAGSQLIATAVAERIPLFGGIGAGVIAAVVLVSTFSGLNGTLMTGPRIFFAMAERGLFFRAVARVSPRYHSPSVAIWLATALGVVYVLQNNFAQLANKFVLGIWPFYVLAVAGVFVLRRKQPDLPRPYRVWGYPLVPLLFLLASLGMVANALWTDPWGTGFTLLVILAGVPLFHLWRWLQARRASPS